MPIRNDPIPFFLFKYANDNITLSWLDPQPKPRVCIGIVYSGRVSKNPFAHSRRAEQSQADPMCNERVLLFASFVVETCPRPSSPSPSPSSRNQWNIFMIRDRSVWDKCVLAWIGSDTLIHCTTLVICYHYRNDDRSCPCSSSSSFSQPLSRISHPHHTLNWASNKASQQQPPPLAWHHFYLPDDRRPTTDDGVQPSPSPNTHSHIATRLIVIIITCALHACSECGQHLLGDVMWCDV